MRRYATVFNLLLTTVLLASCTAAPPAPAPVADAGQVVIEQSPNDDRAYRYLTLDNDLQVLLVSDTETDKAAASLVVFRGSFHEPDAYPGLAHFLEHMLFIGTEKYPEVDAYQHFIAQHGGSSNAYTAGDHTNYFFDIQPEFFPQAMDRFSQFFISPLLAAEYVDREKNAVHSEYQMQLRSDDWRGMAATSMVVNPEHPDSRFSIGSLDTLGNGVQEALETFFEKNYSADQMVLVALSNEPLDAMESWITPMFSAVENRDLGPAPQTVPLFLPDALPTQLYYRTIKDGYAVSYNFPVPATDDHYRQKPDQYISNLLGHEGDGSLYQRLKREGWIESLAAGSTSVDNRNGLIIVSMELTEAGYAHLPQIHDLTFKFIALLKDTPPQRWRYKEQAQVAELGFRFQEKSSATGFVYRTAPAFMHYPPEDILAAPYLMEEFDPGLIEAYLDQLSTDNVVVEVAGPDVPVDSREPWFDVPYKVVSGMPERGAAAVAELALPEPNPYLPEDLEVQTDDGTPPEKAFQAPDLVLWHDLDTSFGTPRANLFLSLGVAGGMGSPEDLALASIYQRLVQDALSAEIYPAYLAGLGYNLSVNGVGFEIQVSGYSDAQLTLLQTVLDRFTALSIDPERFATSKDELLREWSNYRDERPYTQTYGALNYLLLSSRWPPEALIAALEPQTPEDLARWRDARLAAFNVLGLQHGNVTAADTAALSALLQAELPLQAITRVEPTVRTVDAALRYQIPIDHQDASMVLYLQDPDSSIGARALSAMAAQMLRQAYFTSLRTEQQLGYVVSVANRTIRDRGGLAFIVQSPVASPATLEALTRDFLRDQLKSVAQMSDQAFERFQNGLIVKLTEKDRNLVERGQRYWSNLQLGVTTFDTRARIAAAVAGLSRQTMLGYLQDLLARFDDERLIVFSRGRFDEAPQGGVELTDLVGFKNGG